MIRPATDIRPDDAVAWWDGRVVIVDTAARTDDGEVSLTGHLPGGKWVGGVTLPRGTEMVVLARGAIRTPPAGNV